jgi:predicted kinase
MDKPTQYLLVGLPFSGKTTLSNYISKKLGIPRVNLDEVKFEMGFEGVSDNDVTHDQWKKIFDETDKRVIEYLKNGNSVLHETSWTKKWKRDRARKLASDLGLKSVVIYVNNPEAISRERWIKNREEQKRFDLPEDVFEEAVKEFELPTEDENLLIYDQSVPIEDWIKLHFLKSK